MYQATFFSKKLESLVSINGRYGVVFSRAPEPDILKAYVQQLVIPIIRKQRGGLVPLDDFEAIEVGGLPATRSLASGST
jgi:hypothetical protein